MSRLPTLLRVPLLLAAAAASAAAQTVTADPGVTQYVTGSIGSSATGASMVGMSVTATFADNATLVGIWSFLGNTVAGANYGVLFGGRLQLSHLNFDTFPVFAWHLNQLGGARVTKLVLDGAPGLTVFDRRFGSLGLAEGTPGSDIGGDYADLDLLWNGSSAVYRNAVSLGGAAPVGDLYRTLEINFSQALPRYTVLDRDRDIYFSLDTDRVIGTISPVAPVVTPEPGTVALTASGLALVAAAARRRRRA